MATFLFLSANKVPPDLSVRALPEGGSVRGRHHQVDVTEENSVGGGVLSLSVSFYSCAPLTHISVYVDFSVRYLE